MWQLHPFCGGGAPGSGRRRASAKLLSVTEQTAEGDETSYDETQYDPHAAPQWSEDGHYWWDGGQWVTAAEREAELERIALEESARAEAAREQAERAREERAQAAEEKATRLQAQRAEARAQKQASAARRAAEREAADQARSAAATPAVPRPQAEPVRPSTTLPTERSGLGTRTRVALGSLLVAVVLAGVVVALANRGSKPHTPAAPPTPGGAVGSTLLAAAKAEQAYHDKHAGYTGSVLDLTPLGFRPEKGVTLTVLRADAGTYCLSGTKGTAVYYLSSANPVVSATPCS